METGYKHFRGAHCESTVLAGLINHHGGHVTEPFIFGAGSGLSFLHAPFLKLMGLPLTSFRAPVGSIIKKSLKRLGAIMGSGGMVIADEDTCMVDFARFFVDFIQHESCGKCPPCRIGTKRMLEILNRMRPV